MKNKKFYAEECVKSGWSVRQLERQIGTFYYERLLSSQDKGAVSKEIGLPEKVEPKLDSKYKLYLAIEEEFKKELNLENYVKKELTEESNH